MCQEEREEIFAGLAAGWTCRVIGAWLGRNVSVVSREIARNGGRSSYRSSTAQEHADAGRAGGQLCRKVTTRATTSTAGGDVGKSDHHACALDPTGRKIHDKALPNDQDDVAQVLTRLQQLPLLFDRTLDLRSGEPRRSRQSSPGRTTKTPASMSMGPS